MTPSQIFFTALSLSFLVPLLGPAVARAGCYDTTVAALPSKATYDSGQMIEVLSREGDRMTYRQTILESGKQVEMTVQAGLFTLTALRDGEGAVFDWKTALPGLADLKPGASFHAEAILTTPGLLPPRPFTTDVEVLGQETVEIDGCAYSALKVMVKNVEGGKPLGDNTKWIHLPSMITLKSIVADHGSSREQTVTALE
ncbi:MAG: hypothetical protein IAE87_00075 [Rhodobacteraceae bacterium]|jgi:hypothetical protein|nr:hypothetical protein [Paracoccaceae bacterium]